MIFPLNSKTAHGHFLSFYGGSRRQKFKPWTTRIKGPFMSKETKEPNIELSSIPYVFLVCSALRRASWEYHCKATLHSASWEHHSKASDC